LRVCVSNADFPVLWPSPYSMTTTLFTGGDRASHILLPVLPALSYRSAPPPASGARKEGGRRPQFDQSSWYRLSRDFEAGASTAIINLPLGGKIECSVSDADPARARMTIATVEAGEAGRRRVQVESHGSLSSTVDEFVLEIHCSLRENGRTIREKIWNDRIKREFV
jgi:hypothetical protein